MVSLLAKTNLWNLVVKLHLYSGLILFVYSELRKTEMGWEQHYSSADQREEKKSQFATAVAVEEVRWLNPWTVTWCSERKGMKRKSGPSYTRPATDIWCLSILHLCPLLKGNLSELSLEHHIFVHLFHVLAKSAGSVWLQESERTQGSANRAFHGPLLRRRWLHGAIEVSEWRWACKTGTAAASRMWEVATSHLSTTWSHVMPEAEASNNREDRDLHRRLALA